MNYHLPTGSIAKPLRLSFNKYLENMSNKIINLKLLNIYSIQVSGRSSF